MKTDDTNAVPETITAPWLKRFFKQKFGIPVRVENAGSRSFVRIWIMSDPQIRHMDPLSYSYDFPPELGQRCMAIVYKSSETVSKQTWGGNVGPHSIAMYGHELRELLIGLLKHPINAEPVAATV